MTVNDLWYKPVGDGEMEMYQWNGTIWELVVSTGMNAETNQAIGEAKGIAETARQNTENIALDLEEGTSFYKHTNNIGLASKNADGSINSIINLGLDGTAYIGGKNIVLDGNTIVDGTFTVTDTIFAPNMDISKFTVGTLNAANVNLINVNVNSLVGNTSNFVTSNWNANGSDVRITGNGIVTTASDGSQTYIQNGIVGTRNPSGATLGHIGYHWETNRAFYHIQTSLGSNFAISALTGTAGNSVRRTMLDIFPVSSETYIRTNDFRHVGATGDSTLPTARFSGRVTVDDELRLADGNIVNPYGIYFNHGGSIYALSSNSHLRIDANTSLFLRTNNTNTALWFDNTHAYMLRTLSMEGNNITNQSDVRLKTNIKQADIEALKEIERMEFIDYEWDKTNPANANKPDGRFFGIKAQYSPFLQTKAGDSESYLSIDMTKQVHLNSKAIQELYRKVVAIDERTSTS
jgi:hypothetical protein